MKLCITKRRGYWLSSYYRKIAVLSGIIIVIVIFFLGILGWITWSYALGFVTLVGVIVAIIRFYPSNMEYERKTAESTTQKGEMIETEESHDKAETAPSVEVEKRKSVLLPDNTQITKLNIDDSLLDKIYEQAQRIAIDLYHDAQLSRFTIQVFPHAKHGASVNIYLDFYSKWADKICALQYIGLSEDLRHTTPDKGPTIGSDRNVFTTLPWKTSPQWMQFLNRAYTKIRPLPSAEGTCYHLSATPPTDWHLNFEDGFSGREYVFKWNDRGLDENSVKQLR